MKGWKRVLDRTRRRRSRVRWACQGWEDWVRWVVREVVWWRGGEGEGTEAMVEGSMCYAV